VSRQTTRASIATSAALHASGSAGLLAFCASREPIGIVLQGRKAAPRIVTPKTVLIPKKEGSIGDITRNITMRVTFQKRRRHD
jgi:hypothetical protein